MAEAITLKFYKVLTLPGTLEPDSIYFVKDTLDTVATIAITDSSGAVFYTAAGGGGGQAVNAGLPFTYSTNTTNTDPTSGKFKFDDLILGNVGYLYINILDSNGSDVSANFVTWLQSSSTVKGHLLIRKISDPTVFAMCSVFSGINNTGWYTLTIALDNNAGTFSNGDACILDFTYTGDLGSFDQTFNGMSVTFGDPDSGGPGYRQLIVPN